MTSVSVVIPCYKYGHFLEEAVSSVLDDQDGVDVRVLIIDDASPDDSGEVATKVAARDRRVEVVVHAANRGNIATYNEGLLDWADGDYCVLMSADDRLTPGALQRARDLLDAHPSVGFVYGRALWFWQDKPIPTARTRARGWSVWPGEWWIERRFRQVQNNITSPEVVVRTSLQKRVGGYDVRLPHSGDLEMWLRLAANSDVGFIRGTDQAYYRVHGNNMRNSFTDVLDFRQQRLAFEIALDRCSNVISEPKRLSDRVHRKLSREALWAAACAYDQDLAQQVQIDELVDFAFDCWPTANKFPVYHTLQMRKRIGSPVMRKLEPIMVSRLTRKAHGWLRRRSWKYRGY
jgi:glycosyltransferase involved in cell wall biosynthesis